MDPLENIDGERFDVVFSEVVRDRALHALEGGQVLFFPRLAFPLGTDERPFLDPRCSDGRAKNISYDATSGQLKGTALTGHERERLQAMVARFAQSARTLVEGLLPDYAPHLRPGRTSYRPVEAKERPSSYRKDDSRLHVDAFPSRPNGGQRILRVFSNVNPDGRGRVWRLGEPFETCARRFLPTIRPLLPGQSWLLAACGLTAGRRSAYDHYMLALHNAMKADDYFQQHCPQYEVTFPAGTTWMVFTDQVPHAAMAGQYLFEQTFHVPVQGLREPARAPLSVLERLLQRPLIAARDQKGSIRAS
ncbi:Kdo hydroxylase family protein [Acidiferrobacter sp.]|uniref:Kdo hydroxylase family protein n=1 Tax=Acidiferrobacter sp. TaxID=1872107 RepID=UPI00263547A0|nr:Kdo hydroxylase family protein [Acidiferrobacter sp.]